MAHTITTKYPNTEELKGKKIKKQTLTEITVVETKPEIIEIYRKLRQQDYEIAITFKDNPSPVGKEEEQKTPFEIAEELDKLGIAYKATLKNLGKAGLYQDILPMTQLLDAGGHMYKIDAKLSVKESSTINYSDPATFDGENTSVAKFKINPQVSSTHIEDLKGIYDTLNEKNFPYDIEVKPVKIKETDEEHPVDSFTSQLNAFSDNVDVTFTLKDSEAYTKEG